MRRGPSPPRNSGHRSPDLRRPNAAPHAGNRTKRPTERCFIALPLPEAVQAACGQAIEALRPITPVARWSASAAIHLTLKFLGDVPREDLSALEDAVRAAAAAHATFTLRTGALGMFGSRRRLPVAWLGVEGDLAALAALQDTIETACAGLGFPRDGRTYRPHLTLGRLKRGGGPLPPDWPPAEATPAPVEWVVEAVQLYASHLHHTGARHETLAVCSLVSNQPQFENDRSL